MQHHDGQERFGSIQRATGSFWFWTVLTTVMVLWIYAPVRHFDEPVWDDRVHITDNPLVVVESKVLAEPAYWKRLFSRTINGTYIPLTVLSWTMEHILFGSRSLRAAHVTNVLLHLIVCGLMGRLLIALGAGVFEAGLAMLLFGVHPIHVESVAWATQRKDVLYAVLYLSSVLLFVRYLSKRRPAVLFASVACGGLSMLAKPMALSLPLIWGLVAWHLKSSWDKKAAGAWTVLGGAVAGLGWITYQHFKRLPPWTSWTGVIASVLIWLWCFAFYWRSFFWPIGLSPHPVIPQPVRLTQPSYLAGVVIVAGVLGYALWGKDRVLRFAVSWFVFSIFFLLRWDIGYDTTPVADRFMYLPSLGLCWWAARFCCVGMDRGRRFWNETPWIIGVCGVWLVLFLSVSSRAAVTRWRDEISLWSYASTRHPRDAYAHFSLGQALVNEGRLDKALEHYLKAVRLRPGWSRALNNLADLLLRKGEIDKAVTLLEQAVRQEPDYGPARVNLATALLRQARPIQALAIIDAGLKRNDRQGFLWLVRGDVMLRLGRLDEAEEDYRRARSLMGDEAAVLNRIGAVLLRRGRRDEAVRFFERALIVDPLNRPARHNLDLLRGDIRSRHGMGPGPSRIMSNESGAEADPEESSAQAVRVEEKQSNTPKRPVFQGIDIEKASASQGGAFYLPPVSGKRNR